MKLIEIKHLTKEFVTRRGTLHAVDNVSFTIEAGETFGLVGESGCGKSTLGKLLLRLEKATSGEVSFDGRDLFELPSSALKAFRKEAQVIFQDPYASLNPRMTAQDIISEPFIIHKLPFSEKELHALCRQVNLSPSHLKRFPHEFSGGQRQRIGIARALALNPRFVVCDEPISALDVSVQAQVINLLKQLQNDLGLTYLFISHDLRMVKYVADRIGVMYLGHIVEIATSSDLYANPLHPYTQALLSAVPIPDPQIEKKRSRIVLKGDVPTPLNPPRGCVFCTRCPKAFDRCFKERPQSQELAPGHRVACHLYDETK